LLIILFPTMRRQDTNSANPAYPYKKRELKPPATESGQFLPLVSSWRPSYPRRPSSLGAFSTIPPEIRNMIYQGCLHARTTALFRASKQLYYESLPYLREKFVLGFHIDPRAPGSIIYLVDRHGRPWGQSRNIINVDSPHEECMYLDFMPVDQFGKIQIRIDAPDPKDPGQLARCWYQTKRLLTILLPRWRDPDRFPEDELNDIIIPPARVSTRLPPIEVMFHDDDQRRWCRKSARGSIRWNHSVPC
jgi:hypothetical protein